MREKDLDKEKSIIDEVSRIILKEGIADVSMSKIAKASGISSSTIYVYFSDKEDLLKQVYLAKKRQLAAFLSQNINTKPNNSVKFVQQFMYALYDFGMQYYEALMIIEQFNNSPILDSLKIKKEESYQGFEQLFEAVKHTPEFVISSPAVILGFVYAPIVLFVKALKTRQIDNKTIMIDQVVVMCMNALLRK